MPPVSHLLAQTAPRWAQVLAPIVERVASKLFESADFPRRPVKSEAGRTSGPDSGSKRRKLATPLAGSNRSIGQERYRRRPRSQKREARTSVPKTCAMCGKPISTQKRFCPSCWTDQQAESMAGARAILERRRVVGDDPAHGGKAARKRGQSNSRQLRANAEWVHTHGELPSRDVFMREILPGLPDISVCQMVQATGLTRQYCARIRSGGFVPHECHWEALRRLAIPPEGIGTDKPRSVALWNCDLLPPKMSLHVLPSASTE